MPGLSSRSLETIFKLKDHLLLTRSQIQRNDGACKDHPFGCPGMDPHTAVSTTSACLMKLEEEYGFIHRVNRQHYLGVQGGNICRLTPRFSLEMMRSRAAEMGDPNNPVVKTLHRKQQRYISHLLSNPLAAKRHFARSEIFFYVHRSAKQLELQQEIDMNCFLFREFCSIDYSCPLQITIRMPVKEEIYLDRFFLKDPDKIYWRNYYEKILSSNQASRLYLFTDLEDLSPIYKSYSDELKEPRVRGQIYIASHNELNRDGNFFLTEFCNLNDDIDTIF